jgi:pentatricopeptide repeat protein
LQPNAVTYTALVGAYEKGGQGERAAAARVEMQKMQETST